MSRKCSDEIFIQISRHSVPTGRKQSANRTTMIPMNCPLPPGKGQYNVQTPDREMNSPATSIQSLRDVSKKQTGYCCISHHSVYTVINSGYFQPSAWLPEFTVKGAYDS